MHTVAEILIRCISSVPIAVNLLLVGYHLSCLCPLELDQVLLAQFLIVNVLMV